jgi:hypothetical protein
MNAIARLIRSIVTSARFYGRNFAQAMRVVDSPGRIRDLLDKDQTNPGSKFPFVRWHSSRTNAGQ